MKNMKKIVALLLSVLMLSALLCACGSSAKDVPVADLVTAVSGAIGATDVLVDPGESYVKGYMKKDAAEIGDYAIRKNVMGTNIDEFGIFKAGTMQAKDLQAMCESYLQILRDSWMNYQPEEEPKLSGAEVRVVGDYVMYAILSDADRSAAFAAFEAALK